MLSQINHRAFWGVAPVRKAEELVGSCRRNWSALECAREINRGNAYLSPTTSQIIPVLIPPPRASSRLVSPVVHFSSPSCFASSSWRTQCEISLQTRSTIPLASKREILHFRAISFGGVNTKSVTLSILPDKNRCCVRERGATSIKTNPS